MRRPTTMRQWRKLHFTWDIAYSRTAKLSCSAFCFCQESCKIRTKHCCCWWAEILNFVLGRGYPISLSEARWNIFLFFFFKETCFSCSADQIMPILNVCVWRMRLLFGHRGWYQVTCFPPSAATVSTAEKKNITIIYSSHILRYGRWFSASFDNKVMTKASEAHAQLRTRHLMAYL